MKNIKLIVLLLILVGSYSCGKNELERRLDGVWLENPCQFSNCDTLTISKRGYFDSQSNTDASYTEIDANAITVIRDNGTIKDYRIAFSDDYRQLTIYCFGASLQGECINITFDKIE